ncbi:MAG TPA: HAMP domain-containing sensor histidine kinase [Actinocrinis sp.]|nr:HAMP domain-containing sensor histidine kinase [Actinocrinis sp.]
MTDFLHIALISGGCAGGVGLLGLAALRLLRGRTVRLKLFVLAMTIVLAMAAGVLGTAQAMFLSRHDFVVMLGVCVAAGIVALALAVLLARSVTADSRSLQAALRALGESEPEARAFADDRAESYVRLDPGAASRVHDHEHPYPHDYPSAGAAETTGGGTAAPGSVTLGNGQAAIPHQRSPLRPRTRGHAYRRGGLATGELDALSRELANTAARLNESRERERALERSRRELVAWVSHDLRTPLAGLRAMAEALEDGVAPQPALYHTRIRQTVDRLTGMVDDLFELSRIHAGALRLSLAQISLADLVDEAMVGADPLAKARGVRLAADVPGPLAVRCDIRELSRALTNLVANAIRYTPSDGTVRVEAADHGSYVVLAITDACGGIPDEDIGRVFEVAWRGTAARTPEPQVGAGLGLAIVRGIVEAHAGEVDVRNVDGGCRFEVRLPVLAA